MPTLNSGPTPTPVVFYCWENRLVIYLELGDFAVETRLMNWHLGVSASFLGRSVGRCSLRSLICEVKVNRQFVGHDEIVKQFFKIDSLNSDSMLHRKEKRNILNGLDINSGSTTLVLTLIELLVIRVFVNNYIIDIEVKNDLGKR